MKDMSRGRIKALSDGDLHRFWSKILKRSTHECWEWQASTSDGYGQFRLLGLMVKAHQISFFIKNGYLPSMVTHSCDNRKCCNPRHLNEGTPTSNRLEAIARGRAKFGCCQPGQSNYNKGVSYADVKKIRRLAKRKVPYPVIAVEFGVAVTTVSGIVNNHRRTKA